MMEGARVWVEDMIDIGCEGGYTIFPPYIVTESVPLTGRLLKCSNQVMLIQLSKFAPAFFAG